MEIWKTSILTVHYYVIYWGNDSVPLVKPTVVFGQNTDFSYLHDEKELELHIWRIRSTHKYYNLVQYEPKTPTHLRDTALLLFSRIDNL